LEFLLAHQRFPYYDLEIDKAGKKTYIQFEIASDCCMDYAGRFILKHDTLWLRYINESESVCECYCAYRMRFAFDQLGDEPLTWKHLVIEEEKK
jgi:hypothetical protein